MEHIDKLRLKLEAVKSYKLRPAVNEHGWLLIKALDETVRSVVQYANDINVVIAVFNAHDEEFSLRGRLNVDIPAVCLCDDPGNEHWATYYEPGVGWTTNKDPTNTWMCARHYSEQNELLGYDDILDIASDIKHTLSFRLFETNVQGLLFNYCDFMQRCYAPYANIRSIREAKDE